MLYIVSKSWQPLTKDYNYLDKFRLETQKPEPKNISSLWLG